MDEGINNLARRAALIARLHECQAEADRLGADRAAIAIDEAIVNLGGEPHPLDADRT